MENNSESSEFPSAFPSAPNLSAIFSNGSQTTQPSVSNLDRAFNHFFETLTRHEGGYANRSRTADPGRATYMGISSRFYPNEFHTVMDIKRNEGAEAAKNYARDFFKKEFWDPIADRVSKFFDDPNDPRCLATINSAFNMGVLIGPNGIKSIIDRSQGDADRLLDICRNTLASKPPERVAANRGWFNRIDELRGEISDIMDGSHRLFSGNSNSSNNSNNPITSNPAPSLPIRVF